MSRGWGARTAGAEEVVLNVYDLNEANQYLHGFGAGIYHSGVQIGNKEWTFAGGGGIFNHNPKDAPGAVFRCSINMGTLTGGSSAVARAVQELNEEFGPDKYNILSRNCNSFSNAFCMTLLNKPIPGWVNRLAWMGSFFSCLLPPQMLGDAPVNQTGDVSNYSSASRQPQYNAYGGAGVSLGGNSSSNGAQASAPLVSATSSSDSGLTNRDKARQARLAALEKAANKI